MRLTTIEVPPDPPPPMYGALGPGEPIHVPIVELLTGKAWRPELVDFTTGPRATCSSCGQLYSTSSAAPLHPCLEVAPAPASSWDPNLKALERRHRPRHHRGRPHTPHVLVSPPVEESVSRRRCFVCRKPLGAQGVTIHVQMRKRDLWFFRHPWCRGPR